jgi:threonine dehydratase
MTLIRITATDVKAAAERIAGQVRALSVVAADTEPFAPAGQIWFACEYLQHTGSFKPRGQLNRLLVAVERGELTPRGVVIASGGNAALAATWAAGRVGVPATVFVPEAAPAVKVTRLRALGATVTLHGRDVGEALVAAEAHARETGALLLHPYDQPEVCAGAGTLALELLDRVGAVDTILVAVGGGGLLAGIAAVTEAYGDGDRHVIAVEPTGAPALHAALAAGRPVDVTNDSVAADSLGAPRVGEIAFDVATRTGAGSLLVPDEAVVRARAYLWEHYRIVVEHGPATALAPLTSGVYRPRPGERIAVILSGANTDVRSL